MPLSIEWTRTALALPEGVRKELASRLEKLRPFFPEMRNNMKIGITRSFDAWPFSPTLDRQADAGGQEDKEGRLEVSDVLDPFA